MDQNILIGDGSNPKPSNSIRFVCISDTHSRFIQIPEGDVLIHSGDFTKKGQFSQVFEFSNFLTSLNHPYKVIIAGNHDSPFDLKGYNDILKRKRMHDQCDPLAAKRLLRKFTYLEDSYCNIFGYKFWGSPWTKEHNKGAFTLKDNRVLASKWEEIPRGIDILITHSPPYGILDLSKDNRHVGSESLAEKVREIQPKVHVFGHIHESHGVFQSNNTTFINASICNNRYLPIFSPIVFDLPCKNE